MTDEIKAPPVLKRKPDIIPADRGDVRPSNERGDVREEDPRAAAARYAAELREQRVDEDFSDDPDEAIKALEPPGWTYQWHTWSVFEKHMSNNYQSSLKRGWKPVPRARHPELMPVDSDYPDILDNGRILMELPTEIVNEYQAARQTAARNQVRWKEEAIAGTPQGQLPRGEDPRTKPKIKKSFEAMPIPD